MSKQEPGAKVSIDVTAPVRFADQIYDTVKSMVMAYEIRPGDRINEAILAKRLDVSRTPLREALNRLVVEGTVTSTANKGFFVRNLDAAEIFNLYEFRAAVETSAVRLACGRATNQELREIESFVLSSKSEKDDDLCLKFLRLDEEFHEKVAGLSRNDEFVRSIKTINSRIHFVRWIDIQHGGRTHTQNEHLKIVRALERKDADLAARLLSGHISRRLDQISEVIRAGFAEIYSGNSMAQRLWGKSHA